MLTLAGISRRFDATIALEAIDLRIDTGGFVVLLGPSGCGKSTLLRLIAGLDAPDAGRIDWDDHRPPAPGEIGFVFQDATLLPWASAAENVMLPLRLAGRTGAAAQAEVRAMLARVGLAGFEAARPGALSGGMKMRVSIARALISRPKLLLMDEPFAALDEFTRHGLQDDLRFICRDAGTTVVFVTHSIYEAAYLARQIVVMTPRPGRIAATIAADLPDTGERRTSPDYADLVARISDTLREVMPA